jgi:hypothetical protein
MDKISVNFFAQNICGVISKGTSSKWRTKGIIICNDDGYVDIARSIKSLVDAGKRNYAETANDYFNNKYSYIVDTIEEKKQKSENLIQEEKDLEKKINDLKSKGVKSKKADKLPIQNVKVYNSMSHEERQKNIFVGEIEYTYADAMRERTIAEARLKQLELQKQMGFLVPKELMLKIHEKIYMQAQKKFRSLASLVDLIIKEGDVEVGKSLLLDEIDKVLLEMVTDV